MPFCIAISSSFRSAFFRVILSMVLFAANNENPIFFSKTDVLFASLFDSVGATIVVSVSATNVVNIGATNVVSSWSTFQVITFLEVEYNFIGLSFNHCTLFCFCSFVSTTGIRRCWAHSTRETQTSGLFSNALFGCKQSKLSILVLFFPRWFPCTHYHHRAHFLICCVSL